MMHWDRQEGTIPLSGRKDHVERSPHEGLDRKDWPERRTHQLAAKVGMETPPPPPPPQHTPERRNMNEGPSLLIGCLVLTLN